MVVLQRPARWARPVTPSTSSRYLYVSALVHGSHALTLPYARAQGPKYDRDKLQPIPRSEDSSESDTDDDVPLEKSIEFKRES